MVEGAIMLHEAQQPGTVQLLALSALCALGGGLGEAVIDRLQVVHVWWLEQRVLKGDGRAFAVLVPHLGKEKK